jgi:Spx/MgsR family transcriptional regulator
MTTLYGIANCDTVRKARKWLTSHDVDYQFRDFRKDGLNAKQLKNWASKVGWETLLNRRSQTWRKLKDKDKTALTEARALKLMQAEPTLIKRPVLEVNNQVYIGFKDADYQQLFS